MPESKWIDFKEIASNGKTKAFHVVTKDNGAILAHIKWYGAWRKYCFWPIPGTVTVFETQCLSDIIAFLNKINNEWRVLQQIKKQHKL